MIIEIDTFFLEQLISMFIMGCPGGNMAAVSAKRSMKELHNGYYAKNGCHARGRSILHTERQAVCFTRFDQ